MSDEMSPDDRRASFAEVCQTARHYSQLRFVMMGVFTTVLGGCLSVNLQLGTQGAISLLVVATDLGVLLLADVFIKVESRIASLVVQYQEAAAQLPGPVVPLPDGHEQYKEQATRLVCRPLRLAQAVALICLVSEAVILLS
jgi:hypothetical protein